MKSRAFLLAAGFGTRMRPLTECRPKPLVPLCGVPLLDQSVALLKAHGHQSAVVNAHYLSDAIVEWAASQDMDLQVSIEQPEILGTGGGLVAARDSLEDHFVVVNGDVACDVNLEALSEALTGEVAGCMALRPQRAGERYGIVAFDSADFVVDLVGLADAPAQGEVRRDCHFSGIHAMTQEALDRVPTNTEACIVRTAYTELVSARRIASSVHHGLWLDLGNPARYFAANMAALSGVISLPLDPFTQAAWGIRADGAVVEGGWVLDDRVKVERPVWIGEDVEIGVGSEIGPEVVLGRGARVGAQVRLERCVVFDGAVVEDGAVLKDAIVHDEGVLELFPSNG